MRNRGPSKQRVRLGSCRHLCCGRRRHTDADAHCYSDSDRHANGQRHCNSHGHAPPDANTTVWANGKAASHASSQALDFALAKISGDR
jgi:hypothetical protein